MNALDEGRALEQKVIKPVRLQFIENFNGVVYFPEK
jgi:hypothetical protein